MPLHRGKSRKVIEQNIHELITSGKKPSEAVAISLRVAGKRKKGGKS